MTQIFDGEALDADGLKLIAEMAEANDAQIWLEVVTNGENNGVGIVIEDGFVKPAPIESAPE